MRQCTAASLLYQSQYAEPAFRNLQNLIFLKIVGRILAFYIVTVGLFGELTIPTHLKEIDLAWDCHEEF